MIRSNILQVAGDTNLSWHVVEEEVIFAGIPVYCIVGN